MAPCETLSPAEMTIVRNAMKKLKINRELDFELAVDEENLKLLEKNAEYSSTKWKHENLISYHNVIIDIIHDEFVYVIGMQRACPRKKLDFWALSKASEILFLLYIFKIQNFSI